MSKYSLYIHASNFPHSSVMERVFEDCSHTLCREGEQEIHNFFEKIHVIGKQVVSIYSETTSARILPILKIKIKRKILLQEHAYVSLCSDLNATLAIPLSCKSLLHRLFKNSLGNDNIRVITISISINFNHFSIVSTFKTLF